MTTTTASQRLVGAASFGVALSASLAQQIYVGLCYRPDGPGSLADPFTETHASLVDVTTIREQRSVSGTVQPGAGTWQVGACVRNLDAMPLDDNGQSVGWVRVTN